MTQKLGVDVKATFDGANIEATLKRLNERIEAFGKQAGNIHFNPISVEALGGLEKAVHLLEQFEKRSKEAMVGLSADVKKRVKESNQKVADVLQLDLGKIYISPQAQQAAARNILGHVLQGTQFAPSAAVAPVAATPPPKLPAPRTATEHAVFGLMGIIGQAGEGGLHAAGGGGMVISNAIRHARVRAAQAANVEGGGSPLMMGIGGGLGALAGGLAALGIGKLVGGVMNKVGQAEQDAIGIDTLKRQMGDVGVSFTYLQETVRKSAFDMGASYDEAAKAAVEFAKEAGLGAAKQEELGRALPNIIGFARSFGLDIGQSTQMFGAARRFGVSSNEGGDRRLALMIGEAVSKGGMVGRTDELVGALSSFMATQARMAMAPANASGFLGMMAGLTGSGMAGLDPAGAASLIGQVNASVARGGVGEAGQNFSMYALSRGRLDPYDTRLLMEQGAFGNATSAFVGTDGKPSVDAQFRKKFGLAPPPGIDATANLEREIEVLKQESGGNAKRLAAELAGLHGLNLGQAEALLTFGPQQLGKIEQQLKDAKVNMSAITPSAYQALGQLSGASGAELRKQAQAMIDSGRLNSTQLAELQGAKGTEELRNTLMRLTAELGQETSVGTQTRDSINHMDVTLEKLASGLIGPTNTMRDALVLMAGGGHMSERDVLTAAADARRQSRLRHARDEANVPGMIGSDMDLGSASETEIAQRQAQLHETERKINEEENKRLAETLRLYDQADERAGSAGGSPFVKPMSESRMQEILRLTSTSSIYDPFFQKYAGGGITAADLKLAAATESSMDPNAKSKAGALGLMQVMPFKGRFKPGENPLDPETSVRAGAEVLKQALKDAHGDRKEMWNRYYGMGPSGAQYADNALRLGGGGKPIQLTFDTYLHQHDGHGKTVVSRASPVNVQLFPPDDGALRAR